MNPDLAIAAAVIAVIVFTQFTARPVRALAYVWVALLILRGCVPPGPARVTVAGIVFLVVGLAVSVLFGVLRGRTMPIWRDSDGRLWRKGGRTTLLLWLATLAARLAVGAVEVAFGEPFNANALWLGIGVTFGVQHLVLTRRGRRLPPARPEATQAAASLGQASGGTG